MERLFHISFLLLFFSTVLSMQSHAQRSAPESDKKIVTDMVVSHIDITTGFNGAKFEMYGYRENEGDIIVVLRGPDKDMNVRRKEKTWAGWRYGQEVRFNDMPSFYRVASTRPLQDILGVDLLKKHQIGLSALPFLSPKVHEGDLLALFQTAFVRNQQDKHLLAKQIEKISLLGPRFFKVSFYLPHNVPVGEYDVAVYYLKDQKVIEKDEHQLVVKQVGTNSSIQRFAQESPLLYGGLCVLLALLAGWVSNRLKRIL